MKFSKIKLQLIREDNYNYNSKQHNNTQSIVEYINSLNNWQNETNEIVAIICLNSKNQIIAFSEISKGGVNASYLDFKSIFQTIYMCNCSKFILIHNHPSRKRNSKQL